MFFFFAINGWETFIFLFHYTIDKNFYFDFVISVLSFEFSFSFFFSRFWSLFHKSLFTIVSSVFPRNLRFFFFIFFKILGHFSLIFRCNSDFEEVLYWKRWRSFQIKHKFFDSCIPIVGGFLVQGFPRPKKKKLTVI